MHRGLLLACLALLPSGCRREDPPAAVAPAQVMLVAVGDILMHQDVKRAAAENGGFEALWAEAIPLFRGADLVFGNLETPIAPLVGEPGKPYLFNAPAGLPEALKRSGFTILATANNHAYDQGIRGLLETQSRLQVEGLVSVGSGRDRLQAMAPRILERNGIRIAFLAWTDLFNLRLNRAGKGAWVNELETDQACAAVRAARSQADAIVVSVHWGEEDRHDPTPRQRELAARLFEAGADLILGHHPHVLQPLEVSAAGGRRVAVAYSMGNFISNQNRIYDAERMRPVQGDERDGAAVIATFTRTAPDRVGLEKIGYIPLWTENNWRQRQAGATTRHEIRVVRLDAPERQDHPWSGRRARIREFVGSAHEAPAP